MAQPPNPIAQGFRGARRDPASILLEILWRWSFAIVALFLLLVAGMVLLGPLNVGDSFLAAWRSQDPRKWGIIGLSIVLRLGTKLVVALIALPVVLALLWSIFAAAARRIIVRRLNSAAPLGFGSMLAVQGLRALVALVSVALLIASLRGALYAATRGQQPDLFRFYLVAAPSVPLIVILWLVLNWQLSMAAIFGRERQGFGAALRQKRQTIRRHRSDFAGTTFIFWLLRSLVLLIVLAVGGLTSSMLGSSPQVYFALLATVALVYFVVSDFLYVARIASYLALGAAPDPIAAELGIVDPDIPVEESSH
ncbi:MAG TPA: hypothetical protein VE133_15460 [Candidatus Sulfotelmatobacter sp.]|nr:hypothetical protein [Candidatus Sulfotelmatobacter sp.]